MEKDLHLFSSLWNNLHHFKNSIMKDPFKVIVICLTIALFCKVAIVVIEAVEKKHANKAKIEKTK